MIEKRCRLAHAYGWDDAKIRKMDGARSWAYWNWAVDNELTAFGPAFVRTTDGYVAQERKRLLDQWANQEKSK